MEHHPDKARVIVTRVEDDGSSDFAERSVDAVVEHDAAGRPMFKGSQLWGTADGIGTVGPGENPEPVTDPWFPGPGGTRFNLFTFLPASGGSHEAEHSGPPDASESEMLGLAESMDPDRPGMHISDTVDFVYVISGEVILELDRREVTVAAGDVILMRGGWHNWRNESDKPCTVIAVLLGAERQNG